MTHLKRTTILTAALAVLVAVLPAAAQVKDYRNIRYPELAKFEIPRPEIFTLDNGMKVFLMEDHELPLVRVTARIRTGAFYEPAEKTGLAGLVGQVLREGGTARMSGDEIDAYLADRAASIETRIGEDAGYASMDCLKDDFDDVAAVFRDILREPVFAEDRLDLAKVQANSMIARRNDDVNGITRREFGRLIYGPDSPMGRIPEYATIAAITRDDLVAWHKKFFHPNDIYVGVVGDFDSAQMKEKIRNLFGDWPKGPQTPPPPLRFQKDAEPGIFFIRKDDVTQANIRMGHLGIMTSNPDYFAVQVMNEVLGGSFASRLFSNVRSKQGLAYSVGGGVGSSFLYPGLFTVGMQTKLETTARGLEALEQEIRGLIENPPTDEELKRAKESILNSFVFRYASRGQVLNQEMTYDYYGMPADFLEKYRGEIEKVAREDVARVAKKYVHPDRMRILVVGNPEKFDRPLSSFGEVKKIDITIPPPPETEAKVTRNEETLKKGAEVLARAGAALAGEDPSATRGFESRGTSVANVQGNSFSIGQEVSVTFPDKIRQVAQTPMGEQVMELDGDQGTISMGERSQPIPPQVIGRIREQMAQNLDYLVHFYRDPEMVAVAAGTEDVDGTPCTVVAVEYHGTKTRLWVDERGRVLRQRYQGQHPFTRVPGKIEMDFSDYREVNGLLVPFHRVMKVDGQEVMNTTLESFQMK